MITVYHGGTETIKLPQVGLGRDNLDFGKGFYLTDIEQQAKDWAKVVAERRLLKPVVNTYTLDIDSIMNSSFRFHRFSSYDIQWLTFICNNRQGKNDWKQYDIIEGGVANDRVTPTIELFMKSYISLEEALRRLAMHQPNNQLCITNQEIINQYLHFVESYNIE